MQTMSTTKAHWFYGMRARTVSMKNTIEKLNVAGVMLTLFLYPSTATARPLPTHANTPVHQQEAMQINPSQKESETKSANVTKSRDIEISSSGLAEITQPCSSYYGIYDGTRKLGWHRTSLNNEDVFGRAVYVFEEETHRFSKDSLGNRIETVSEEKAYFDKTAPHKFEKWFRRYVKIRYTEHGRKQIVYEETEVIERAFKTGGYEISRVYEVDGDDVRVDLGVPIRVTSVVNGLSELTMGDFVALELWLSQQPKRGDQLREEIIDFYDGPNAIITSEVQATTPAPEDSDYTVQYGIKIHYGTRFYDATYFVTITDNYEVSLYRFPDHNRPGPEQPMLDYRLEQKTSAREMDEKAHLDPDFFLRHLAIYGEVDGSDGQPFYRFKVQGDRIKDIPRWTPYQYIEFEESGESILTLETNVNYYKDATDEEVQEHLRETGRYPVSNRNIQREATDIKRHAENLFFLDDDDRTRYYTQRVRDRTEEYINGSHVVVGESTVPEIFESNQGDCTEKALLFTTLARAVGIPTREVYGLMYLPHENRFERHAWNEVIVDGKWIPVDVGFRLLGETKMHLKLGHGKEGKVQFGRIMETGLHFAVVDDPNR